MGCLIKGKKSDDVQEPVLIISNSLLQAHYEETKYIYDDDRNQWYMFKQSIKFKINNTIYQLLQCNKWKGGSISYCQELIVNCNEYKYQNRLSLQIQKQGRNNRYPQKPISISSHIKGFTLSYHKKSIKIKSLKFHKLINKIKIQKPLLSSVCYDQSNGKLIYLQTLDNGQYLNVMNIKNRQIIISQQEISKNYIITIRSIHNTNYLLIQIYGQGLVLYKIIYETKKIERIKILNHHIYQECIIDDDNQLILITQEFLVRFDKDFNTIQKFKINFKCIANTFSPPDAWFKKIPIKYYDNFIFHDQYILQFNYDQIQTNGKWTEESQIQKFECISELNNYQMEYQQNEGNLQHLISFDEKYLAYKVQQILIFHIIEDNFDLCVDCEKQIRFLNFSLDSNSLFVILEDRMICYKSKQKLKQFRQVYTKITNSIAIQNGMLITIDKQGQVRALSKQLNKQIFKLATIKTQFTSFDQCKGTIMVSSNSEIKLFSLLDRRLIIQQDIVNIQCKMTQNTQQLLIIDYMNQLQLWMIEENSLIFQKNIMKDVRVILQQLQNKHCFRTFEWIIVLDEDFNMIEKIFQQHEYFYDLLIDQWDQIISENFILKIKEQIRVEDERRYQYILLQRLDFEKETRSKNGNFSAQIIISLEPRNQSVC